MRVSQFHHNFIQAGCIKWSDNFSSNLPLFSQVDEIHMPSGPAVSNLMRFTCLQNQQFNMGYGNLKVKRGQSHAKLIAQSHFHRGRLVWVYPQQQRTGTRSSKAHTVPPTHLTQTGQPTCSQTVESATRSTCEEGNLHHYITGFSLIRSCIKEEATYNQKHPFLSVWWDSHAFTTSSLIIWVCGFHIHEWMKSIREANNIVWSYLTEREHYSLTKTRMSADTWANMTIIPPVGFKRR